MQKFFFMWAVSLLLVLALGSAVMAKEVLLPSVMAFDIGREMEGVVNLENRLGVDARGMHVMVSIPELGIRAARTGPFTLEAGDEVSRRLFMDVYDAAPGEYYVRVVVSNDDVRRVRHRLLTIQ